MVGLPVRQQPTGKRLLQPAIGLKACDRETTALPLYGRSQRSRDAPFWPLCEGERRAVTSGPTAG